MLFPRACSFFPKFLCLRVIHIVLFDELIHFYIPYSLVKCGTVYISIFPPVNIKVVLFLFKNVVTKSAEMIILVTDFVIHTNPFF